MKLKKLLIFTVILSVVAAVSIAPASALSGSLGDIVGTLFGENTTTVDIIILLTILTLLPTIVIMFTAFTRIVIVLSFVRNASGMQQTPPNQVIIGLALFLTLFVMGPAFTEVYEEAYKPYVQQEITQDEFFKVAVAPFREFMVRQTYTKDMNFFIGLSREELPEMPAITDDMTDTEFREVLEAIPLKVLIPAFLTSEIKHAFILGFVIYIPFIVIDMIVASTLMAMGMMMLPPAMISMPFKILLFVMVDGWQMIIGALITGFN